MLSKHLKFKDPDRRQVINKSDVDYTCNLAGQYDVTGKIKEGVMCSRCGKIHLLEDESTKTTKRFISIYGNIHMNDKGGLLGTGDWDENGVFVYHFCPRCLIKDIKDWYKLKDTQDSL